jgi:hypothetical protein
MTVSPDMDARTGSPYPDVVVDGDELATLLSTLERNRRTFAWKCGGLDDAGLRATVGASTMTLGGLVKHLALVETDWFAGKLRGEQLGDPWDSADWDDDADWEWSSAAQDSPPELYTLWNAAVARARACVAAALDDGDLGTPGRHTWPAGRAPTLRRIVVDMIEEYARHTGHADLLRESVDGMVGESQPQPS